MIIVFCHHAKRDRKGSQEDDITELGVKDAKISAEFISEIKNLKAIYTSPFFRCEKTANILNEKLNLPIYEEPRLNEYKSVKGENWVDLQKRIVEALDDINSKYNNDDVVVCVTSGVNSVGFIDWSFGLEPNKDLPIIRIPSCSPMGFEKNNENKFEKMFFDRAFKYKNKKSLKPTFGELKYQIFYRLKVEMSKFLELVEKKHLIKNKEKSSCAEIFQLLEDISKIYKFEFMDKSDFENFDIKVLCEGIKENIEKLDIKRPDAEICNIYNYMMAYVEHFKLKQVFELKEKLFHNEGDYISGNWYFE